MEFELAREVGPQAGTELINQHLDKECSTMRPYAMRATAAPSVHAVTTRLCPNCRGMMTEVDRVFENNAIFIWYECTDTRCGGQWLDKKAIGRRLH